jgi:hypothetical protein
MNVGRRHDEYVSVTGCVGVAPLAGASCGQECQTQDQNQAGNLEVVCLSPL